MTQSQAASGAATKPARSPQDSAVGACACRSPLSELLRVPRGRQGSARRVAMSPSCADHEPIRPLAHVWRAQDLATALASAPQKIQKLWNEITPMARWEWIRWVNATKNPDTRRRRVDVSISKMKSGKRRPCCFNLSACTDPDLSKNGRLLEPGDDTP